MKEQTGRNAARGVERLRSIKLRRAGHPVPLARREPGGEYIEIAMAGGGLLEYGYPEEVLFLVRTDIEPEPGDLVIVERELTTFDGKPIRSDGDEGIRMGILGRKKDGSPRLESLTCGAYTYGLRRVIGKVIGPATFTPLVIEKTETVVDEANNGGELGLDWPELIPG